LVTFCGLEYSPFGQNKCTTQCHTGSVVNPLPYNDCLES
jgi:hypothetical protein